MTRVLLVDDHASFRQPFAFMLERLSDVTVVAQAGTRAEAKQAPTDIDLAIVDLGLPDGDGVDVVRDLRACNARVRILVLTSAIDPRHLARAVEAGADGLMHKSMPIEEIIRAIQCLIDGEDLLSPSEVVKLLRQTAHHREQDREAKQAWERLTPREREVVHALADGLTDKQIAERLHMSDETARTHMVHVLRKLGLETRLQVLVFAIRHGMVKIV